MRGVDLVNMAESDVGFSTDTRTPSRLSSERQELEASLTVQAEHLCPMGSLEGDISLIDVVPDGDRCVTEFFTGNMEKTCEGIDNVGGRCECGDEAGDHGDAAVVRASLKPQRECICNVFKRYGCSPRITGREGGRFKIDTYLPERETLTCLIQDLKELTQDVQVTRIQEVNDSPDTDNRCTVDLSRLTPAQQECLTVALDNGYFDDPRGISQAELAEELGISASAVSRRLRAIEKHMFEQMRSDICFD